MTRNFEITKVVTQPDGQLTIYFGPKGHTFGSMQELRDTVAVALEDGIMENLLLGILLANSAIAADIKKAAGKTLTFDDNTGVLRVTN